MIRKDISILLMVYFFGVTMFINLKEKIIIEKYLEKSIYQIEPLPNEKFDFKFNDLDATINLLTDIFMNFGLCENDEPNETGLILDDLIGRLWQYKLNETK